MSNLAFYATPVDFNKNANLEKKLNDTKKSKLNSHMLKKLATTPSIEDVKNIHLGIEEENDLKEENESTLADFYSSEIDQDLNKKLSAQKFKQDNYRNENVNTDYLISNNLNTNQINNSLSSGMKINNQEELLTKLNYIIKMFEEQKEIKTNKKNEEIILYCFLGIFTIYVMDSFVSIGKYKR